MKHKMLAVLLLFPLPCFADSISFDTFVLQERGVSVQLGQGLDPLVHPDLVNGEFLLSFFTAVGPIGSVTYSSVLSLGGQQFTSATQTFDCVNTNKCKLLYTFAAPPIYALTPGGLTVNLNGVTAKYDFQFSTPVPEPMTLLLVGTGLIFGVWRRRALK